MSDEKPENPTAQQSLSVDASPIPRRSSPEYSRQSEDQRQNDQRADESWNSGDTLHLRPTGSFGNIPDPPTDWEFNVFLKQLADSLSIEELHSMKSLFHGEGGIGRGVLEKMQNSLDLFRILRTRGYISRDNLLYLQAILFWAGRKDLVQMAVEYSKTIGNVLHFYAPSDQPENGYKYVKFHVDGKDFRNYDRHEIESLRSKVGKLLFVPQRFIFIRGIEPSSSLVITLMIPEMYVDILRDLLEEGEDFASLQDIGVDTVEVDGKVAYNIKGSCQELVSEWEQQTKFVNVYEQFKQTKARLDESEVECIEISRKMDLLQSKLNSMEENLSKSENQLYAVKRVFSMTRDETQPATLKELSSLKEFTESLHQINLESVDKKIIQRMLNATVNIVSTRARESHKIQEQKMLLDLQEMQSKLIPLMYELERYKILTNVSNIDKATLDSMQLLLQSLLAPAQILQQQISLTPHGLQMTRKISSKLRHKEKEKLKQKYQWFPEGKIEKFMKDDQSLFLAGLFYKEIELTGTVVHAESFIAQCLTDVSRDDLKKFLEQKPNANPPSPRYTTEARQKPEGQHGQGLPGQQQQRAHWQQPNQESAQGQQYQQQHHDQAVLITRMAQQVQEMYNTLQAKQNVFSSKYEPWKTPSFQFEPQLFQGNQAV